MVPGWQYTCNNFVLNQTQRGLPRMYQHRLVKPLQIVSQLRNCFRCGVDFVGNAGTRICPSCRVPATPRKKTLRPALSFRERQIVTLVAQAKLNKEIAHELHLTEGTVKEYLNRIFKKIGASNRTEVAVWALTRPAEAMSL